MNMNAIYWDVEIVLFCRFIQNLTIQEITLLYPTHYPNPCTIHNPNPNPNTYSNPKLNPTPNPKTLGCVENSRVRPNSALMSCIFFYTFQALSDVDEVYRIPSTGQRFYHEEKLTYSKVFIGQLLSTSNLPCTGKQLCSKTSQLHTSWNSKNNKVVSKLNDALFYVPT